MKIEVSEDERGLLIKALEHYHAYTVAKQREDGRVRELAERLKRKPAELAARDETAQRRTSRRA